MENSDMESVFKTYLESYKRHHLDTRATSDLSCPDGIQWLWLVFGECLLSAAQMTGCFCGALSMLLWTVGYLMASSQIQPANRLRNLLILTFIVNVVSFAGAVISFQIIFVIWYDMLTTLILLLIITAVLLMMTELIRPCHKYQQLDNADQDQATPSATQRSILGMLSTRVCCVFLCLATISLFLTVFIALASIDVLSEPSPSEPAAVDYFVHVILGTVGSLLGCLACVGRWWIAVSFVSVFDKEIGKSRIFTGRCVLLILSNVLYLLGVLLQSGSPRVAMAALPWLVGRTVQGCYQCFNHVLWFVCPLRKHDIATDSKTKIKSVKDAETDNLLASSESDCRDIQVIFDRTLDVSENRQMLEHEDSGATTTMWRSTTLQVSSLDVATTSDSETTNITSEQELIWNDHVAMPASADFTELSLLRHQRLSLASQIETMSQSSSETSDQRVRSWISQSTPEEETPPCLTLTLNLDTVSKSTNNMTGDNFFQNRKCNFAGKLQSGLRKNSV